jgi:uncharacterized protein GlcG (DUF336 family)
MTATRNPKVRVLATLAILLAALAPTVGARADDGVFTIRQLTPETALKATQAALAACRQQGYQVSVAVVDRSGTPQTLLRDRFAGPHTVTIAIDKAWTAVTLRQNTTSVAQISSTAEMSGLRHFPRVVAVGGGMMIEGGGSLLGGIGVSGAPGGAADDVCAQAGIQAILDEINF